MFNTTKQASLFAAKTVLEIPTTTNTLLPFKIKMMRTKAESHINNYSSSKCLMTGIHGLYLIG